MYHCESNGSRADGFGWTLISLGQWEFLNEPAGWDMDLLRGGGVCWGIRRRINAFAARWALRITAF
jgi:hypothetical protein